MDGRPCQGHLHPHFWPDPTYKPVCIHFKRDLNEKGRLLDGRKPCPMGTVKRTEGVSPLKEKALGTMNPLEGKIYSVYSTGQNWSHGYKSQESRFKPEIEQC